MVKLLQNLTIRDIQPRPQRGRPSRRISSSVRSFFIVPSLGIKKEF